MKNLIILALILLNAVPAMAYTNSTLYCTDNNTLVEVIQVDFLNTSNIAQVLNTSAYAVSTICDFGCDNTTMTCAPTTSYQYIIMFAVVCIVAFFGYKFLKWMNR